MKEKTLKAYMIQEPCEGSGEIGFFYSNIEARKHGANEFNQGES